MTAAGIDRATARGLALACAVVVGAGCGPKRGAEGGGAGGGAGSGGVTVADAAVAPDDEARDAEQVAVIEKAMNDLAPAANACWAVAAADDFRLAGTLTLAIDFDAAAAAAVTVEDDTTGDPALGDCLRRVAAAYPWPAVMAGAATRLPLAFTAPSGQFVVERGYVPEPAAGARVLLDGKNSGNRGVSMFELRLPAGTTATPTASDRAEVWFYLSAPGAGAVPAAAAGDAIFLPPGAARAPAAPADAELRVLIVAVPGGDEDATRATGVLPASPAGLRDKQRPKAKVIRAADVAPLVRKDAAGAEVGRVQILAERATTGSDVLSASRLRFDAGAVIPPHVHDGATELLYVVAGRATMVVDGVTLEVGPDSVVQIPPGIEHSATVTAALDAYQLYTPAGPEQRFRK